MGWGGRRPTENLALASKTTAADLTPLTVRAGVAVCSRAHAHARRPQPGGGCRAVPVATPRDAIPPTVDGARWWRQPSRAAATREKSSRKPTKAAAKAAAGGLSSHPAREKTREYTKREHKTAHH